MRILDDVTGKPISLTDFAIDEGIRAYTKTFGVAPGDLGGVLGKSNKLNYQRVFFEAIQKGLPEEEAKIVALRKVSFGKHRIAHGYDDFHVSISDYGNIDLGGPYGKQSVPRKIRVSAKRFSRAH